MKNQVVKIKQIRASSIMVILVLLLTSTIIGCQNKNVKLKEHFTNSELDLINELTQYYKQTICGTEFSKQCLNEHLSSIRESYISNKSMDLKINGEQLEEIISKYDKTKSNGIFTKDCAIKNLEKEVSVQFYCLNSKGNLNNYLKSLSSKDGLFTEFVESLESLGDVSIISTDHIVRNFEDYEFYKSQNLVLIIIHHSILELEWKARDKMDKIEQDTIANKR